MDAVVDALRGHPAGLTGPELLTEMRGRWPKLSEAQLRQILERAGAAIVAGDGRYRAAGWGTAAPNEGPAQTAQPPWPQAGASTSADRAAGAGPYAAAPTRPPQRAPGPLRAVAFDLEAIPRLVARAPYVERAVWQVGAVRFGRDTAWVAAAPRMVAWVDIAAGFSVPTPAAAATHAAHAISAAAAYGTLSAFCDQADLLVAYNGTGLDFGVLDAACDAAGVRRIDGPERVDALYLAYAWWPTEPSARLRPLATAVGVDTAGLHWHDAADDAEMLARLVTHGATTITGAWSAGLANLISALSTASPSWRLVFDLAEPARGGPPAVAPLDEAAVAATIESEIVTSPMRPGTPPPAGLGVPAAWRGPDGAVDPYRLSASINPNATRRSAQDQMAAEIRARFATGPDLAVEAPTGTGKSFAALAAAVDWLGADDGHRVVIATHTKQLQAQLAADVEALAAAAPDLLTNTSLVKGATNRLSMRALVNMCADVTARTRRSGVVADTRFAELVVYLLLRLVSAPRSLVDAHEARSVDTADVPAFFAEYSSGRWGAYLAALSQAAAGDYTDTAGLGAHTRNVTEHLDGYRLVIANHALVFAHLDDLDRHASQTLLIIDEAHAAEGSATEAFSSSFVYQQVERVEGLLSAWASRADATAALVGTATTLSSVLGTERPARMAMKAIDRLSGVPASEHGRAGTVASPFSGDAGAGSARPFLSEIGKIARACRAASKALAAWYETNNTGLSRRERDRYAELASRLTEVAKGAAGVVADVDSLLGTTFLRGSAAPLAPGDGRTTKEISADSGAGAVTQAQFPGTKTPGPNTLSRPPRVDAPAGAEPVAIDYLDSDRDTDVADDGPGADTDAADPAFDPGAATGTADETITAEVGGDPPAPPAGNRVVWIAEQPGSTLAAGNRHYRFELRSSPVRLSADADWVRFRTMFARTVFTSATLTVAGGWDYLFDRLGIVDCDTVVLAGPFDYAHQARLVCFEDFPSWSEHTEAAMRTVAHQLTGYAAEAIAAGRTPGAMVLTTATATAAGIAEHLGAYCASAGLEVALAAAPIRGNRQAVERFREDGGWLVGTKGLWAGVDIPEADRARIVWINKVPFAPFADPLVAARRADVAARAETAGHPDPDAAATEHYYLPLSAIELRQAAGRLIRSSAHRGVIIVSDRKLAGAASTRRLYRRILLGSLDADLLIDDPVTGETAGGNVVSMVEGWARVWEFLAADADIDPARLASLVAADALDAQTLLAETRAIRDLALSTADVAAHRRAGTLAAEVLERSRRVGGLLRFEDRLLTLKPEQEQAIAAAADGKDLLGLLPTGFGKSYCFQLPALVLPGLTIVVSPLVALMTDQALELNKAIGGAVRALVSPLRESSSRAGRQEVAEQLTGTVEHHIKLVYVSPERFAHRQFRDWVRAGIAAGRIDRIVFDEAHTLVQWGDDFRPAYRRLATALGDLRSAGGARLPMSALTATANRAVREGLRTSLFDLPAAVDPVTGDPATFTWVQANPIRPELAVYKMQLAVGGTVSVARHVESVFDALDGHAVFYCLTVREVDALWAHLVDYVGPAAAVRVRRFHGRLAEAEKASVLGDFRDAPAAGDEDFAPMVVVATSAFGLGINRGDIRCVFVTSPPTDLAALYQQLGRAGRNASGTIPADDGEANVGVALATHRGFRTVEFLTRDLSLRVLDDAARAVLSADRVLDACTTGDAILAADVAAGHVRAADAAKDAVRDRYRTAVVRALAALAEAGTVDDLGDLPATVRLTPGETPAPLGADRADAFARAARAFVDADPARAAKTSVPSLHTALAAAGVVDPSDVAATWAALVELHHAGVLDVSAAPNRTWLTALRVRSRVVPASFTDTVSARRRRAATDLAALRAWYANNTTCANQGFADYLAPVPPGIVPPGTCSTAPCRCTSHWATNGTGTMPAVLDAVLHPTPRPASASDDRIRRARLDRDLERLLYDCPGGLGPATIKLCLQGKDTYYDVQAAKRRPLRHELLYHRLFGSRPGLQTEAVVDSLNRLATTGVVVTDGYRWRSAARVAAQAAAANRAAAAVAAGDPATAATPAPVPGVAAVGSPGPAPEVTVTGP